MSAHVGSVHNHENATWCCRTEIVFHVIDGATTVPIKPEIVIPGLEKHPRLGALLVIDVAVSRPDPSERIAQSLEMAGTSCRVWRWLVQA